MAYGKRLIEIGKALGPVHAGLIKKNSEISLFKEDQEHLKVLLIPIGGWSGKNEAERSADRDRCYFSNERMTQNRERLVGLQRELNSLLSDEALFEDERRSIEYAVRDRLCNLLDTNEESGGDIDVVQLVRQIDNLSKEVQPEEHLGVKPSAPAASVPSPVAIAPDLSNVTEFLESPLPAITAPDLSKIKDVLDVKLESPVTPDPLTPWEYVAVEGTEKPVLAKAPAAKPMAQVPVTKTSSPVPDLNKASSLPSEKEVEDILSSLGF